MIKRNYHLFLIRHPRHLTATIALSQNRDGVIFNPQSDGTDWGLDDFILYWAFGIGGRHSMR